MIGWTLGRYFFWCYVKTTCYFLVGMFTLALLMDFTENAGRLAGLAQYSTSGAILLSALRIPAIMQQLFPFVALFSAMVTLMRLNRKFELVIARSIGVSAWQFLMPACLGAFLFGVLAVVAVNPIAAWGTNKAEIIAAQWHGKQPLPTKNLNRISWLTQKTDEGTTTIGAKTVLNHGLTLVDATFVQFDADGKVDDWLDVNRAELMKGYWLLLNGTRYRAGSGPEPFTNVTIPSKLKPEFLEEQLADPDTIPFYELPQKIKVARSFGYAANEFDMKLQSLIALPVLLVAMTLIAATVSLKFVRFGQSKTVILGGVLAGFMLYVITVLVRAFGEAGYVSPVIAAWTPVVIALFFGISFLLHKEDG